MGAAKAKLWSLLAILGSLGCSLMPPGDCRFLKGVLMVSSRKHVILNCTSQKKKKKGTESRRKRNKQTSALMSFKPLVVIQNKVINHPFSS